MMKIIKDLTNREVVVIILVVVAVVVVVVEVVVVEVEVVVYNIYDNDRYSSCIPVFCMK